GPAVGLPWGEMGNSEVGHLNIGAGRIVGQDLARITLAIEDRSFFQNPAFLNAINHVKKNNSAMHLAGLVSPGGVHSYDEHLFALLGLMAEQGITNVYVHMFLDGRDTPPQIAMETLQKLNKKIDELKIGRIATVAGRFYSMDRGEHWNLTEQTYRAMVFGEGPTSASAEQAIQTNYDQHIFDEMVPPTVITNPQQEPGVVKDKDSIIFFNFRPDRALQLARAFAQPGFSKFTKPTVNFKDLYAVSMTEYSQEIKVEIAFPPIEVVNNLAEVFSKQGLRQYHIAESEKYAHVSVFFNGGVINPFPGEDREIVTSPVSNYQNYEDVPEMSAYKVTENLLSKLKSNYSFLLVNFANSDMVGHTGSIPASVEAIKAVDNCLKKISEACLEQDICLVITADHGNIEELLDKRSGGIDKEHSTNPVPLILVANQFKLKAPREDGIVSLANMMPTGVLSDVAPTILELMAMNKPAEMTGVSLLPELLRQLR
ncbi:MAG TPA: 2,3-bisphosphoglycerate-independent phosphoglycerate mutase, partial [Verrucomicrobiae bacterium]|nr:2,3-bisphosphoglycerate-independent phosphoglycerate mutase [Verrucomicrobiae bacterium]